MPKPALIPKRGAEPVESTESREPEEFVIEATGEPAPATPATTPQPTTTVATQRRLPYVDAQSKYEALLELILSLSDEQIRTFFTPDGVKYILEQFAQRGDPIAKLAKAHCTK